MWGGDVCKEAAPGNKSLGGVSPLFVLLIDPSASNGRALPEMGAGWDFLTYFLGPRRLVQCPAEACPIQRSARGSG